MGNFPLRCQITAFLASLSHLTGRCILFHYQPPSPLQSLRSPTSQTQKLILQSAPTLVLHHQQYGKGQTFSSFCPLYHILGKILSLRLYAPLTNNPRQAQDREQGWSTCFQYTSKNWKYPRYT